MIFTGICPKCRGAMRWEGRTVDDRPKCPACGFLADGRRIDAEDKKIEATRSAGDGERDAELKAGG